MFLEWTKTWIHGNDFKPILYRGFQFWVFTLSWNIPHVHDGGQNVHGLYQNSFPYSKNMPLARPSEWCIPSTGHFPKSEFWSPEKITCGSLQWKMEIGLQPSLPDFWISCCEHFLPCCASERFLPSTYRYASLQVGMLVSSYLMHISQELTFFWEKTV